MLNLFVVDHLIEEGEEDRTVDYLRTVDDYFIEEAEQGELHLDVLLLHYAELVQLLELELDGGSDDVGVRLRGHALRYCIMIIEEY